MTRPAPDLRSWLAGHLAEIDAGVEGVDADRVESWGRDLADRLIDGARLLAAGNGGSAAEAQHLTAELVGRYRDERRPMSAICLSAETSALTALINDYGPAEMFARQVQAHGRTGDVLVLLSTSGRSPNVLASAARARDLGITTWALTGPGPNPLTEACDDAVAVDAPTTAAVQTVHLVLVHALCEAVDARLAERDGPPAAAPVPVSGPAGTARTGPSGPRVVVIGDVVLDRDVDGRTERLSPDAPVPVVDVEAVRESAGGAGLTALLCADAGARVVLIAPLARDRAGDTVERMLRSRMEVIRLPHQGGTRRKIRIRSAGQSLVRVDDGGPGTPGTLDTALLGRIDAALACADAVLVSDYGAGTTHCAPLRERLAALAGRGRIVWDPHPRGGLPVPGCLLVTPNRAEAQLWLGRHRPERTDVRAVDLLAELLRDTVDARGLCVTDGAAGAYLSIAGSDTRYLPAAAVAAGDPCGAGDRFAAAAALHLAGGGVLSEAVQEAVDQATAWVAAGGAEGYRRAHAPDAVPTPSVSVRAPAAEADKGCAAGDLAEVSGWSRTLQAQGRSVVATGGCFDIVHAGHIATLQAARRLGDALVVVINSDASVRRLKGPTRPVVTAADRARVLSALDCVDAVVVFDEDDPTAVLDRLRPDLWVKGGDYGGAPLPESATVRRHGGRVVLLPYLSGRSTTAILRRSAGDSTASPGSVVPG